MASENGGLAGEVLAGAGEVSAPNRNGGRNSTRRKVGIIGAGSVGATIAYAAMIRGVARHISLFDIAKSKVDAEVLDLNHGLLFAPQAMVDGSDDVEVLRDCDVVVMTAGAKQKPGETRMDLAAANANLCKKILPDVVRVAPDAMLLLVTNPVDVITDLAIKITGFEWNRVIGSGTVLDSSRFRYLVAKHCGVAVQNVHAYIAGEHGDTEIPLWSSATIGSIPLNQWAVQGHGRLAAKDKDEIVRNVKEAAYQVIQGKGATNYAVGLAVTNILESILYDESRVLAVSGRLQGFRGMEDVCLSVPRIVSCRGIEPPLPIPMTVDEETGLQASAERIRSVVHELGF
ncbi:L-lactate dehydrogenase [Occallatibacter riparius]|uniref:L-lactate dehydrogenase n=1 Tax=Occallatibacter riparius TaxID=1002689 RepID=A0A9J7BP12_9BACT|nr:L-lactate dehydrogenase [Occallatibacter riparius]UWZ84456.1 L-lactate dehydrogenase [Occallatibacter riparius]